VTFIAHFVTYRIFLMDYLGYIWKVDDCRTNFQNRVFGCQHLSGIGFTVNNIISFWIKPCEKY
ncbi:MAG: hypothetical protein RIM68_11300, partial [Arenibacter sp.]